MERPGYDTALRRAKALEALAAFDPHVVGTPPLGIALPGSDIDIICHAPDGMAFCTALWEAFSAEAGFTLRQWTSGERAIIASFTAHGWDFEVFGAAIPVGQQAGWRHFEVERRLLALGGEGFRAEIMRRRLAGLKTEPAFAAALALPGNPYQALLALCSETDPALAARLAGAGFSLGDVPREPSPQPG
ncbi:hypothetical protein HMPREF9946_04087 [Acetobacteraceae bacterium AT-5844]|nr:hypothetical protein HMPREF9946_04087 [Acetobacteraceae bacterium AT-5844]